MSDETDVRAWESRLRSSGQVSDCRIIWRNTLAGEKRLVAYVTTAAGLTSAELGEIVGYSRTDIDVVPVDTIPLRRDGLPMMIPFFRGPYLTTLCCDTSRKTRVIVSPDGMLRRSFNTHKHRASTFRM
jgi:hypothetical protein